MPSTNYKSPKHRSAPPAALAGGGFALLVLVVGWILLTGKPEPIRHPVPEMSLVSAPHAVAPGAEKAAPPKVVYRYSVIPGGVHSAAELALVVQRDAVVMAHYADFNVAAARLQRVERSRLVHVSYRIGDKIYWTRNKVRLAVGESLLSDGKHLVRARCGNRIADVPQGPVLDNEPAPEVLDALFVSAEDLIDQAVNVAAVFGAPSAAPAATARTVTLPLIARVPSEMQGFAPVPAIALPNMWNVHKPASWSPPPPVDSIAFATPVAELPGPIVLGSAGNVDQPESPVTGKPDGVNPQVPKPPNTPEQNSPPPFTMPTPFGPQGPPAIDSPSTPTPMPTPIPEPDSAALIGLALIALTLVRRRSRK